MKSNFDDEMKALAAQMHEAELDSIPQKEELQGRYKLSDVFYGKMRRLSRKVDRKKKVISAVRYAAATAAVIAICCIVTQPGIVTKACEELIRKFEEHINFKFKGDLDIAVVPEYEAGYVPDGYVLEESYYDELGGLLVYWKGENRLTIEYGRSDKSLNIDHEDKKYEIIDLEDGIEIHYFKSESGEKSNSMIWLSKDEKIVFSLIAKLSEEELMKIQKNLREKKIK